MKSTFVSAVILGSFLLGSYQAGAQSVTQRYEQQKTQYTNAVGVYKSARKDFITARNKYVAQKNAASLAGALEEAKAFLTATGNAMIAYIDLVAAKLATVPGIDDATRSATLSELESDKAWVEARLAELPSATTKEQLVEKGKIMKDRWVKIQVHAKSVTGKILIYRIDKALEQSKSVIARVEAKIAELKAEGKDTSELEALVAEAKENLDLAQQKRDQGQAQFVQIGGAGTYGNVVEADKLLRNGHAFIKEANQYVREAYAVYKEGVAELQ